jgi:hypothetical protein
VSEVRRSSCRDLIALEDDEKVDVMDDRDADRARPDEDRALRLGVEEWDDWDPKLEPPMVEFDPRTGDWAVGLEAWLPSGAVPVTANISPLSLGSLLLLECLQGFWKNRLRSEVDP